MAAFSSFQHHHPFPLDSIFPPNNPCLSFSQFYQPEIENSPQQNIDHSTNVSSGPGNINNETSVVSVTNKNSMDSTSIVTDHKYDQNIINPMDKKRKSKQGPCANSAQSKDKREVKGKKQKKMKDGEEINKKSNIEEGKKAEKEAPKGYIHVRARRGQATDSHSLAERVRREKISERMKLLQAIVPGCDKVTGKALMLDEIINYVQSLQNQVEFLSMKLASVNPMLYDFGMDLESFMVRPDQDLSNLPSQLPSMQDCNPTTANDNYHLLDNSVNSVLFQQAQIPNVLPQENRQALWEVDELRQKNINQSGFNNTLFSFH